MFDFVWFQHKIDRDRVCIEPTSFTDYITVPFAVARGKVEKSAHSTEIYGPNVVKSWYSIDQINFRAHKRSLQ